MTQKELTDLLITGKVSSPPARTDSESAHEKPERLNKRLVLVSVTALLLWAGLAYAFYGLHGRQVDQNRTFEAHSREIGQTLELITKRLEGNDDQLAALASHTEITMKRIGVTQQELKSARQLAERLREEQARNVEVLGEQIAQKANAENVVRLERESGQKFAGVDRDITTVKEEVKDTRQNLTDTMAQLAAIGVKVNEQGKLIATNGTGLEELRRRGEREYVAFDLRKKQKSRVAGIILELRDTDLGKNPDADLRIYANDTRMERKDLPLNTPVNFYVGADRIAYELVVNEVFKNRCTGYVSVPKGKLPQGPPALAMP